MAFQTNVLRNGQWVTETADFQAALKVFAVPKPVDEQSPERQPCGILSRTVVQSPITRLILPAKLRSGRYNDIAFIGDNSVLIKQLLKDGQTRDIFRHEVTISRIRNATVIGVCPEDSGDDEGDDLYHQKDSTQSSASDNEDTKESLPPQILVLVLENGELLFLFLKEHSDGMCSLVLNRMSLSSAGLPALGFHLAVDPSSRYMVFACPEDLMIVQELHTWSSMNEKYMATGVLDPIKASQMRGIHGAIHSVEFLHPRPEDDYHVILVLAVFRKEHREGSSLFKMITYDWEVGETLSMVFSRDLSGTRLHEFEEFPLFLIPLKFQAAFFVIYNTRVALVKQALSAPESEFATLQSPKPTKLHHGKNAPVWTAWTRPFRLKSYAEKTDIIFLAREDGVLIHIEVDAASLTHAITEIGNLNTNISKAFTAAYDIFSDMIIVGGESGPGGIWKLLPRDNPQQVISIPNWSPVVDMTSTDEHLTWDAINPISIGGGTTRSTTKQKRLFLASGRGQNGSLIEKRVGIQARIGLEVDIGEPIRSAWLFHDDRTDDGSMFAILAFPHASTVVRFSKDFKEVSAEPHETTQFDVSSRTVYVVRTTSNTLLQVTETSLTLITPSQSSRHPLNELTKVANARAETAFCLADVVVISTPSPDTSQLHVLRIEQMDIVLSGTWSIDGEVSCLVLVTASDQTFALVGSQIDGHPTLSVCSLDGNIVARQLIRENYEEAADAHTPLEALTSICVVQVTRAAIDIVCGTRCGRLITMQISDSPARPFLWGVEKLGLAPVEVFSANCNERSKAAFACHDGMLIRLSAYTSSKPKFSCKDILWGTDQSNLALPSPPIHSMYSIRTGGQHSARAHALLLLLSGTKLILADTDLHAGPVPRSISVGGTPTRIMYSHVWNCVVVGLIKNSRTTLAFVDCDSGSIISDAYDKDRNPCDYISGLGQAGDRILSLYEWLYVKDGQTFPFVLVATRAGGLLVVSVREVEVSVDGVPSRRLQYWTRYRKRGFKEPVSAIIPDAEGLFYCVGRTIYWDVLDLKDKKMKSMAQFELESPATALRRVGDNVLALTTMHSLQVINHRASEDVYEMELSHTDQKARHCIHMMTMGPTDDQQFWPVTMVSDMAGGIAGLWMPLGKSKKELVVAFEGQLPKSVRRFVRAHCRPPWDVEEHHRSKFGVLQSTTDGAEILGVSLDGSIRHFALLGTELWRFLAFVQHMAHMALLQKQPAGWAMYDPESFDARAITSNMHIDGDSLVDCLRRRLLETIMATPRAVSMMCEFLDMLEDGCLTSNFTKEGEMGGRDSASYFDLGYQVLGYVLAPVI